MERSIEGNGRTVRRTLLEVFFGSMDQLQGSELESTLLEASDDFSNESTLDTVRL